MKKTIVVYGSSTGTCEAIADNIASKLEVEAINVTDFSAATIQSYDNLLLGTSTWGAGELQDDWYDGIDVLKGNSLEGKTVAVFGCGDAESYPDTFCGAMADIYKAAKNSGATMIGETSTDGYSFEASDAVVDGKFMGLALDDINENDKTDSRVNAWIETIKPQL